MDGCSDALSDSNAFLLVRFASATCSLLCSVYIDLDAWISLWHHVKAERYDP